MNSRIEHRIVLVTDAPGRWVRTPGAFREDPLSGHALWAGTGHNATIKWGQYRQEEARIRPRGKPRPAFSAASDHRADPCRCIWIRRSSGVQPIAFPALSHALGAVDWAVIWRPHPEKRHFPGNSSLLANLFPGQGGDIIGPCITENLSGDDVSAPYARSAWPAWD